MRIHLFFLFLFGSTVFAQRPPQGSPWSAGVASIVRSQSYKGVGADVIGFPTLTYRGERLQWYGPRIQYKVLQQGAWRLDVGAQWDFGAYEESDAALLEGLGDSEATALGVASLRYTVCRGTRATLSAAWDLLDQHGGGWATLDMNHTLIPPFAKFSAIGSVGVEWLSAEWMEDRVGVSVDAARLDRPAYGPGEGWNLTSRLDCRYRVTDRWMVLASPRIRILGDEWKNSPLVGESVDLSVMLSVQRGF